MLPFIEELYDTCQQSIESFNDEIDDLYDSLSVFQETLKEFSEELSDLFENFDSICAATADEDISAAEILNVLRFLGEIQAFGNLLSKTKKKKLCKTGSAGSKDPLRLCASDNSRAFSEDDEIPFV